MKFFRIALFCVGCFSFHSMKTEVEQTQDKVEELIDFIGDQIQKREEVVLSPEAKERLEALQRQNDFLENAIENRLNKIKELQKKESKKESFAPQIKKHQDSIRTSRDQINLNNKQIEEIKAFN